MRTAIIFVVLALVLATSVAANAKPLPGGMKVIAKAGRPYVQQGTATVALRDDDAADYEKILKAELGADGKTVVVTASRCAGTLPTDETSVPLATIQARIDNANGLAAMTKKRYADAMAKFGSAAQKDPTTPAYATNLLAAQVLGKKLDIAAQTLAMQGAKNPAWFAWQLATDPQLAAVKDHKRAKALLATTPGTATLATLGERDLATTDVGGGMAALRTSSTSKGSPGTTDVDIVSLSTGHLLARLPLTTLEDACDETDQHPCSDEVKATIAGRRKVADELLASLGFAIQAGAFIDVRNGDPVKKDGIAIELADDGVTVTTKTGDEKTLPTDGASTWAVALTPKAIVVKLERRHVNACDDSSTRLSGVALPL